MGHSTFTRIKRGALSGAGIVAVSLATALPASAALGGAKPGSIALRPNLVSVSVSGSQATYRFDRPLQDQTTTAGNFTVTSNAGGQLVGQQAQVNGSTVTVGFANDRDLSKCVAGGVAANTVTALNQTGRNNQYDDTAPITTTDSKDGTRGFAAAPQLVSVRRESATVLIYVFDRRLVGPAVNGAFFAVSDAGVGQVNGDAGPATATVAGNEVKVTFTNGTTALNNAQSAVAGNGAVTSRTQNNPLNGADNTSIVSRVALPGKTETTGRADLTGAALVPASFGFGQQTSVEYTFDDAVTPNNLAEFQVVLANGLRVGASSVSQDPLAPNKVIANFTTGGNGNAATTGGQEFAVAAVANTGAANSQGGIPVSPNSADLGGNAGASAAGFTVAPEVLGVTKADSNQVNVTVDSRLTVAPGNIQLLTSEGAVLATPSTGSAASAFQGSPGTKTLVYNVPGSANVTDAVSVFFPTGTFTGKLGASYPQVVGF